VHHTLARNSGARFSELGFAALVQKSANDEKLAERLGLRLDIPLTLLRQLLARAGDLVRSRRRLRKDRCDSCRFIRRRRTAPKCRDGRAGNKAPIRLAQSMN
jgi:hypothetical protein